MTMTCMSAGRAGSSRQPSKLGLAVAEAVQSNMVAPRATVCGMSSAFVQTLIGAAAAIVGGVGAALWQTARADDVARRIRKAERREQALIDLNALVTVIYGQLLALYHRAAGGQNAGVHSRV